MSRSLRIQRRFDARRNLRRCVGITYLITFGIYLAWRTTIFAPHSMSMSILYFVADFFGFLLGIATVATAWSYRHREPVAPPAGMDVTVLIPTYLEPAAIIRMTVQAAVRIDYPHRTLVLDDGNRPEIREIAAACGAEYRCRGENRNAKAGNLNFGLAQTDSEYIAVFDADHVPQRESLDHLLGFLADDAEVAMVQSPQDYYNTDAIQYVRAGRNDALWHDQSFFYDISQASRDAANAATCVGTGVVYRRSALEEIGGIPTDTVTEDMHTSLKLHKRGWKTLFLNESLAYGVAAADLPEYYKTRHRWAHGNLQGLQRERILGCAGLTPAQRMSYLSLGLIYLEGWQQLIFFIVPAVALIFGLPPFEITIFNVAVVLLFPIWSYLLLQELGCGYARFWVNEIFAMARFPVHLRATAALFGRKTPWRSSAKNLSGELNWRMLAPQVGVAALGLVAVAVGVWRLYPDFRTGPIMEFLLIPYYVVRGELFFIDIDWFAALREGYTLDLFVVAAFWALYNCVRALFFVRMAVQRARASRPAFRFEVPFPVALAGATPDAVTRWVSTADLAIRQDAATLPAVKPGQALDARLWLPSGILQARLEVVRADPTAIEARFVWPGDAPDDALVSALYSVDWHREFRFREAYFLTPIETIGSLLRLRRHRTPTPRWAAALVRTGAASDEKPPAYGVALLAEDGADVEQLIGFEPHAAGELLDIRLFGVEQPDWTGPWQVAGAAERQSILSRNLDGTAVAVYLITKATAVALPGDNARESRRDEAPHASAPPLAARTLGRRFDAHPTVSAPTASSRLTRRELLSVLAGVGIGIGLHQAFRPADPGDADEPTEILQFDLPEPPPEGQSVGLEHFLALSRIITCRPDLPEAPAVKLFPVFMQEDWAEKHVVTAYTGLRKLLLEGAACGELHAHAHAGLLGEGELWFVDHLLRTWYLGVYYLAGAAPVRLLYAEALFWEPIGDFSVQHFLESMPWGAWSEPPA